LNKFGLQELLLDRHHQRKSWRQFGTQFL
jgi:hypothetical protein